MLDKIWNDVLANNEGDVGSNNQRSLSVPLSPGAPATPMTPTTPFPRALGMGSQVFDKPPPNSPTVYDRLYSGETRSKQVCSYVFVPHCRLYGGETMNKHHH